MFKRGTLMIVLGIILLLFAGSQAHFAPNNTVFAFTLFPGVLCTTIGIIRRRTPERIKEPELIITPEEHRHGRVLQAAKGSWVAPLLALLVSNFGRQFIEGESARAVAIALMFAIAALILLGIVFAVLALSKVQQYGSRGIAAPAVIGLLLSVTVGAIFLLPFVLLPYH